MRVNRTIHTVTKADVEHAIAFYVEVLGLTDWTITLTYNGVDKDTWAHIDCAYEYKRADLGINLENMTSLGMLNRKIVHELTHCILSPLCNVVMHYVSDDGALKTLICQQELVVTHLEHLPIWDHIIPPKRKTRKK